MKKAILTLAICGLISGCDSSPSAPIVEVSERPTPQPQIRMEVLQDYTSEINNGARVTILRDSHTGDEYIVIHDNGETMYRLTASGHSKAQYDGLDGVTKK